MSGICDCSSRSIECLGVWWLWSSYGAVSFFGLDRMKVSIKWESGVVRMFQ